MNKKILAGVMIGLLVISPVLAAPIDLTPEPIAEADVNQFAVAEMNAGITPDNGFGWMLDRAAEKVRMAFTFGAENKMKYGLKLQEERTLEARQMLAEGKGEAAEKAMVQVRAIEQERNSLEEGVKEAQTKAEAIRKGK